MSQYAETPRILIFCDKSDFLSRIRLLDERLLDLPVLLEHYFDGEQLQAADAHAVCALLIRCSRQHTSSTFFTQLRNRFSKAVLIALFDEQMIWDSHDFDLLGFDDFLLETTCFEDSAASLLRQAAGLPAIQQVTPAFEKHRALSRSLFVGKLIHDHGYNESLDRINRKFCLNLVPGLFRVGLLHVDFNQESTHFEILEIFQDRVVRYVHRLFSDICSDFIFEYRLIGYIIYFNYAEAQESVFRNRCELLLQLLRHQLHCTMGTCVSLSMSLSSVHSDWKGWELAWQEAYRTIHLRFLDNRNEHVLCHSEIPASDVQGAARALPAIRQELLMACQTLDFKKFEYKTHQLLSLYVQLNSCQDFPQEMYDAVTFFFTSHSATLDGQIDSADTGKQIRGMMRKKRSIPQFINCMLTGIQPFFILVDQLSQRIQPKPIRFAMNYVSTHYDEPITVQGISTMVHLTPGYFSSLFKKETGQTFSSYVVECKMERAKELLCSSDASVYEISRQLGFADQRYFSKRFIRFTGLTPTKYRKCCGNHFYGQST